MPTIGDRRREMERTIASLRAKLAEVERMFREEAAHYQACSHDLAAEQAENARLREALEHIAEYWNGLENPTATSDAANMARDTALATLASSPSSASALREVCRKVAERAWSAGWNHACEQGPGDPTSDPDKCDAIVDAILGPEVTR